MKQYPNTFRSFGLRLKKKGDVPLLVKIIVFTCIGLVLYVLVTMLWKLLSPLFQ